MIWSSSILEMPCLNNNIKYFWGSFVAVWGRCPAVLMPTWVSSTAPTFCWQRAALVNGHFPRNILLWKPSKIFFFPFQFFFWTDLQAQDLDIVSTLLCCSLDFKCHLHRITEWFECEMGTTRMKLIRNKRNSFCLKRQVEEVRKSSWLLLFSRVTWKICFPGLFLEVIVLWIQLVKLVLCRCCEAGPVAW